jgi:oligoendopeptidase F
MVMLAPLPETTVDFKHWSWEQIEPYFTELLNTPLTPHNAESWLRGWTHLAELISETGERLAVATTLDTTDQEAEKSYFNFLDHIRPQWEAADQKLKEKLLASGLQPSGFEIPLRNMRSDAELFRPENIPLSIEITKFGKEYDRLKGAQTVNWDGDDLTLYQMAKHLASPDRATRERAWRATMTRSLQDREALNALWQRILPLRWQIAKNAGFPDFRAYAWRYKQRFDYTPDDCLRFHDAIEQTVVPAVKRLAERKRAAMQIDTLRPWDLDVRTNPDPLNRAPLKPYATVQEMESKAANIFAHVDPELGEEYEAMRRGQLLDLENRKGKAPGGYCTAFSRERRPFIFMNAVGLHDDVQTLLHEAGHSFHVFETAHLPYIQQLDVPMEMAEVASMAMELLAQPYLTAEVGGYYTAAEAARATTEHLEGMLLFWPYMAVVDAFQHWVYTSGEAALDPKQCDAAWGKLYDRFMGYQDWRGLDEEKVTGWHRKLHIYHAPFYYVEYGLAQLGAAQVWRNALRDQATATAAYRRALALGATRSLPALYEAAGAKLAFDAETLGEAVDLIEATVEGLRGAAERG